MIYSREVKNNSALEKYKVIAPQIIFNPQTGEELLFFTGADYNFGWWMMLARETNLQFPSK